MQIKKVFKISPYACDYNILNDRMIPLRKVQEVGGLVNKVVMLLI